MSGMWIKRAGRRTTFLVRGSLKAKLALSVTSLLLALVVVFGSIVRAGIQDRLETKWRHQVTALVRNLAIGAELGVSAEIGSYLAGSVRGALDLEDVRYVIVTDASGRELYAEGDSLHAPPFERPGGPAPGGEVYVRSLPGKGGNYEALSPVMTEPPAADLEGTLMDEGVTPKSRVIGWVRVGFTNDSVRSETAILSRRLALAACLVLLLGFLAASMLARRLTEPLRRLAQAATAIGQGQWDHTVHVGGHDEIAYLAARFQRMAFDLHTSEQAIVEQNKTLEVKVAERTASLSRAMEELRELDRMKDAFLSSVSHELRTPLTAIRSFSESMLLYEDEPVETRREFLTVINRETERLSRLIEDVLDLSKIQSGKRQWVMEHFPIEEVVVTTVAAVAPLAAERNVTLSMPDGASRTFVYASRDGVQQVIQNLLGNAIKFSPPGGTISIHIVGLDGRVRLEVADEGPGIPEAELTRVFDRFHQVGDALTGKPKGTGLGLAICREIIRQHRGEIWVERREGGGSLFVFLLPDSEPKEGEETSSATDPGLSVAGAADLVASCAGGPQAPPKRFTSAAPAAGVRPDRSSPSILVVDDEPSIRRLFEHELTRRGYRVSLAENGLAAVEMARRLLPSLILLDVMMPDLMGFDVIRILKNDPLTSAIPIVVVSVVEDREGGLRLGANDYLTKPVRPSALVSRIEALLAVQPPKLLLVSGDVEASADINAHLSQTRYAIEFAHSFDSAWSRLEDGGIHLVVLDGLDRGRGAADFLRRLRGTPALASLPVLVLTSQSVGAAEVWGAADERERRIPRDAGPASIAIALQELLDAPEPRREVA